MRAKYERKKNDKKKYSKQTLIYELIQFYKISVIVFCDLLHECVNFFVLLNLGNNIFNY